MTSCRSQCASPFRALTRWTDSHAHRIQAHIAKSDVVYSPVLLYQPLERPEDASLPLITPLPPPPGSTPKKGRRGQKPGQTSAQPTPVLGQQTAAAAEESSTSIDSLFAKFTSPPPPQPNTAAQDNAAAGLRGPALLQTMFASAAAGNGDSTMVGTSTTSSTVTTSAILPPNSNQPITTSTTKQTTTTSTADVPAVDGVMQGNMLKQLLGIPVQSPPAPALAPPPTTSQAKTVADLFSDALSKPLPPSNVPSRAQSIPPGFVPINEDEEQTPPRQPARMHTPPNLHAYPPEQTTPTPSKPKQNGANRDLLPYDFEEAGIVSPWMNEPLQRPKEAKAAPPSPSQLPQPKAVREKNSRSKRTGSPRPQRQQQQQQQPRQTYVPHNDSVGEGGRRLERNAAADALLGALNGVHLGASGVEEPLSRETFVQELLGLIHVRRPLRLLVLEADLGIVESRWIC